MRILSLLLLLASSSIVDGLTQTISRGGDIKFRCSGKDNTCCTKDKKDWKKVVRAQGSKETITDEGSCFNDGTFDDCQKRRCEVQCDTGCTVTLDLKDTRDKKAECYSVRPS